ncbi:MAG: SDR family NAD(P)-dependent oxidoreductase [Bdellovibrionaceae bacterium]|nr:SDR family NAD(P)-dependent oxidoreductase [Pseudobdellovibrionaceae bacterium]
MDKQHSPLAVITGASSGIGYELAKIFAKNGYDLIVAAENIEIVDAGNELRKYGTQVKTVQVDLTSLDGVERLYHTIQLADNPLSAIALNAGVGICGAFTQTEFKRELEVINLNITSLVYLTKLVLPHFVRSKSGKILFTSSVAADMPGPYYAVYAASKAFVQSFAEAVREEVNDSGVTVTALQPGATDTNFFKRAGMMNTKVGVGLKDSPTLVAQEGFNALMAGKDHVIAGSFINKVQSTLAKLMPQTQGAKMQREEVKPGSAYRH